MNSLGWPLFSNTAYNSGADTGFRKEFGGGGVTVSTKTRSIHMHAHDVFPSLLGFGVPHKEVGVPTPQDTPCIRPCDYDDLRNCFMLKLRGDIKIQFLWSQVST